MLITDRFLIGKQYLKGFFLVDLISNVPFELIFESIVVTTN